MAPAVGAFLLVVGLYVIIDMSVNLDEYLTEHADGTSPAHGFLTPDTHGGVARGTP